MQPGDRLIVCFVEPRTVGWQFSQWPLHLTIVPWFRGNFTTTELVRALRGVLAQIRPFTVSMGEQAEFGYNGNKVVRLVNLPIPVTQLEQLVRSELKARGAWIADESTKRQRTYRPHVTNQADSALDADATFVCATLAIVEQKGAYKEVMAEVKL